MTLYTETLPRQTVLPEAELIKLHQAIDNALPDQSSRLVQFLSCYPREGAGTVASELAMLESKTLHGRALFITLDDRALRRASPDAPAKASLLDVALGRAAITDAVTNMRKNTGCECAYLMSGNEAELLPNLNRLKDVLTQLRNRFDYILMSTPGVLTDPVAVQLGTIVDAAVLVIEAEGTRAPAAKRALQMFSSGSKLIGIVFNKRRYHIPDWLYRLL